MAWHDYGAVSVGGVWPLVRDVGAPGGLRFARVGEDLPEGCVSSPSDLPEAEVTVRTFAEPEAARAWAEAAVEFGGNAVSASHMGRPLPAALVMRFDRGPRPGTTLDEVVSVSGVGTNAAMARDQAASQARSREGLISWERAWADVRAAVEAMPDRLSYPRDIELARSRGHLSLEVAGGAVVDDLHMMHTDAGTRMGLRDRASAFGGREGITGEADLDAALVARAAAVGLEVDGSEFVRTVRRADAAAIGALLEDVEALSTHVRAARSLAGDRSRLRSVLADDRCMRVLRDVDRGLPLATSDRGISVHQVNDWNGFARKLDHGNWEGWLWQAGLIEPVWWGARSDRATDHHRPLATFDLALWLATPLGSALARGRVDAMTGAPLLGAAAAAARAKVPARDDPSTPPPLAILAERDFGEGWEPPGDVGIGPMPLPAMPRAGRGVRLPRNPAELAIVGAWVCQGRFDPTTGEVMEPVAHSPR